MKQNVDTLKDESINKPLTKLTKKKCEGPNDQ